MDLKVLFQNSDLVVVDKPSGLSVHNNEDSSNLLKVLETNLSLSKIHPVHRLDKETSGVQILALNEASAKKYAQEFEKREVEKIYIGVLRGQLKTNGGVWNQPLSDKSEGRKNPQGVSRDRVPCETRFKVLNANKFFSLCEFQLITGRQHQIRKHAALVNHAIVGDQRYGDQNYNKKMADLYKDPRMFLHCSKIVLAGQTYVASTPDSFGKLFP